MATCFVNTHFQGESAGWIEIILLLLFIAIPIGNLIFAFFHLFVLYSEIKSRKAILTMKVFIRYAIYISVYFILSFLMISVYIIEFIVYNLKGKVGNNYIYRYYSFFVGIIFCGTPLISGVLRVILSPSIRKNIYSMFFKSQFWQMEEERNLLELNSFESSQLISLTNSIFIGACYCLGKSKNKQTKTVDELNENDAKEIILYSVTKESIQNDNMLQLMGDPIYLQPEEISISLTVFSPKVFANLRAEDQINIDEMITSLLPDNNRSQLTKTSGKGGGLFLCSEDNQYILKTVNANEIKVIQEKVVLNLAKHFAKNPKSIISRIYGLFRIDLGIGTFSEKGGPAFIIMRNIYGIFPEVNVKYDLKGSKYNREEILDENKISGEKSFQGKDRDFDENEGGTLYLTKSEQRRLIENATKDSQFFQKLGIMDYSLFVVKIGLNRDEIIALFGEDFEEKSTKEYNDIMGKTIEPKKTVKKDIPYVANNLSFSLDKIKPLRKYLFSRYDQNMNVIAIIDFFQEFTFGKKMEKAFKQLKADEIEISSVDPGMYQYRFIAYITQIANSEMSLKEFSKDNNSSSSLEE